MKNIVRSFWITLTRFKIASILNIFGLAIAFAVFAVIMMQSYWEFSYNGSIKDGERICRFESNLAFDAPMTANTSRALGEALGKSSPMVVDYTLIWEQGDVMMDVSRNGQMAKMEAQLTYAGQTFPAFFNLKLIQGSFADFATTTNAIVDEVTAKELFGDENPIGKQLFFSDTVTIVAVYAAFTDNCTLNNGVYTNIGNQSIDSKSEWSYQYYYKTLNPSMMPMLKSSFVSEITKMYGEEQADVVIEDHIRTMPFDDIYFDGGGYGDKGNMALSLTLLSIAFLVVLIAVINFINFFLALVPVRIKAVNISKVFGAPRRALQFNIVGEAIGTVVIAFLLSLAIVEVAGKTSVAQFVNCDINIWNNLHVIALTAIIAAVVGLAAGLYPAYYITKFNPMMVLRGSFGRSKAGRRLRTTLVSVQYIISIALIIASTFIYIQTDYMMNQGMGFNRDRLLTVRVGGKIAQQPQTFKDEITKNPAIIGVTFSDANPVNIGMSWGRQFNGQDITLVSLPVTWNYPQFMGLELIDGRFFIEDDASKTGGTMIVNETAAKKYGFKVGDFMNGHTDDAPAEVVGVVADFNFRSLKYSVEPIVLYEFGSNGWRAPSTANIRIAPNADTKNVYATISAAMKKINPSITDESIDIQAFDASIEELYFKEKRLTSVITLFSLVAIIISLVGVFGLVVFEIQYRRREIALRKVMGATSGSIPVMINRQFGIITAISAVIAIPITYYFVWNWMQEFSYRAPLYWWVAAIAVALVFVITFAIVTFQTYKVANENPIRSLKSE